MEKIVNMWYSKMCTLYTEARTMAQILWQYQNPGRLTSIEEALARQEELFQKKLAGDPCNYVLFVEHESVYTCTPRAMQRIDTLCKVAKEKLPAPLVELPNNHGGTITYHGPGQLVCYLILDLGQLGISPLRLNKIIDETVIEMLADCGICAHSKPKDFPDLVSGVWITPAGRVPRKIASRGIWANKIFGGITKYGFALNIQTELLYFERYIYPCGCDIPMTSMHQSTGKRYDVWEIAYALSKILARQLTAT